MKHIVKKLLIPILASRPVATIANRFIGCGIPIFMLHRMDCGEHSIAGGTQPDHLRRCLQYLVDHDYGLISLEQLVTALKNGQSLPSKAVAFTMDDGFADQAKFATPIFAEFNCPLTFFVITGMLDQALWPWDAQVAWITERSDKASLETAVAGKAFTLSLGDAYSRRLSKRELHDAIREVPSDQVEGIMNRIAHDAGVVIPEKPPASYQPMSWEMARQLEREGIQFAPHSVSHNVLSRLDDESMTQEISDSWYTLVKELHNPLKVFCYPAGREIDYNKREIDALRDNSYLGAVTTTPDYVEAANASDEQLFRLPRFPLPESMHEFIQYCTWIEYAKSKHRTKRS
ncbi:MAG: polysaccharide deacetylase family protein [Gammaproteobacteria bacterium]